MSLLDEDGVSPKFANASDPPLLFSSLNSFVLFTHASPGYKINIHVINGNDKARLSRAVRGGGKLSPGRFLASRCVWRRSGATALESGKSGSLAFRPNGFAVSP